jgi:hypothetical protein
MTRLMRGVYMHRYTLSCSAEAGDLEPVVIAVHELIHRLPVTAKSLEKDGIRVEDGKVIDRHKNYTFQRRIQGRSGYGYSNTGS